MKTYNCNQNLFMYKIKIKKNNNNNNKGCNLFSYGNFDHSYCDEQLVSWDKNQWSSIFIIYIKTGIW